MPTIMPMTRQQVAQLLAGDIPDGSVVNLCSRMSLSGGR